MLREFMILSTTLVILAAPAALVLAYPVLLAVRKTFGKPIGFFHAFFLVFLTDVLAHILVMALYFTFGAYRPPVIMGFMPLLVNFIFMVAVSLALTCWSVAKPNNVGEVVGQHGVLALLAAVIITVKNIALYWLLYWLTPPLPG